MRPSLRENRGQTGQLGHGCKEEVWIPGMDQFMVVKEVKGGRKNIVNLFLLSFVNRGNKSVMGLIGFFSLLNAQ